MPQLPSIIVTGNSGLIGRRVVEALSPTHQVFGLDIKEPEGDSPASFQFIKTDLTDDDSVNNAVRQVAEQSDGRIASVIHLAAYYDFSGEPSPLYEKITVRGSERLVKALRQADVEQFIFSSTMLVHEPTEPGRKINEDSPITGDWDYPESKVRTEKLLRAQRDGMKLLLLRIAGVYNEDCNSIPLSNQIQRIREDRATGKVYPGNLDAGQAFVHLDDLVDAFKLAVERRAELPDEQALLIGEPETPSYGELQDEIGKLIHGEPWETKQIPKTVAKTGAWLQDKMPGVDDPFIKPWMIDHADDHYELDISRARELLGWEPHNRLRQVLPSIIGRLQQDPVAWYKANNLKLSEEEQERVKSQPASR